MPSSKQKESGKAEESAAMLGLKVYHQTDPRGWPIYLIDETMNDSTYSSGIGILK